jgi:hypothetical protein
MRAMHSGRKGAALVAAFFLCLSRSAFATQFQETQGKFDVVSDPAVACASAMQWQQTMLRPGTSIALDACRIEGVNLVIHFHCIGAACLVNGDQMNYAALVDYVFPDRKEH